MTIYHGMFLVDVAEPSINGWENQLGWRGYYEEWKNPDGESFWMEVDEDIPADMFDCIWVLLWQDENGNQDHIASGSFEQVDMIAKLIMAVHRKGRPPACITNPITEMVLVSIPSGRSTEDQQ